MGDSLRHLSIVMLLVVACAGSMLAHTVPGDTTPTPNLFYVLLLDSNPFTPSIRAYEVNDGNTEVDLDEAFASMISIVGERNFDLYDGTDGKITKM